MVTMGSAANDVRQKVKPSKPHVGMLVVEFQRDLRDQPSTLQFCDVSRSIQVCGVKDAPSISVAGASDENPASVMKSGLALTMKGGP
jgi:hypothetical protein